MCVCVCRGSCCLRFSTVYDAVDDDDDEEEEVDDEEADDDDDADEDEESDEDDEDVDESEEVELDLDDDGDGEAFRLLFAFVASERMSSVVSCCCSGAGVGAGSGCCCCTATTIDFWLVLASPDDLSMGEDEREREALFFVNFLVESRDSRVAGGGEGRWAGAAACGCGTGECDLALSTWALELLGSWRAVVLVDGRWESASVSRLLLFGEAARGGEYLQMTNGNIKKLLMKLDFLNRNVHFFLWLVHTDTQKDVCVLFF